MQGIMCEREGGLYKCVKIYMFWGDFDALCRCFSMSFLEISLFWRMNLWLKKVLSYLFPQHLKTVESPYSGKLELVVVNGAVLLDSENSNYSYGSLHRILEIGIAEVGLDARFRSALVLGMGGGSIVKIIRDKLNSKAAIDLVEMDPVVIVIAKEVYQIQQYRDVRIIHARAEDFVRSSGSKYDFILVDLFIQSTIPKACLSSEFLIGLGEMLQPGGVLMYNTIAETMEVNGLEELCRQLEQAQLTCRIVRKVLGTNDLVIAKKAKVEN